MPVNTKRSTTKNLTPSSARKAKIVAATDALPFRPINKVKLLDVDGPAGAMSFEKETGIVRRLLHKASGIDLCAEKQENQLAQIAGVRIWDDLAERWWDDFTDPGSLSDIEATPGHLTFVKHFDGCPFVVRHVIDLSENPSRWNLDITQNQDVNRGLEVVFQVPLIAGWKYFAACAAGHTDEDGRPGDCVFDGNTFFNFMYHVGPSFNGNETTLPLFALYKSEADAGLQFAAPGGAEVPAVWYEYGNRGQYAWGSQRKDVPALYPHLDIKYRFIGLHGTKTCHVPMDIYFGRGDHRPLLGQFVEKHRSMFFPKCDKVWDRVGTFQCSRVDLAEDDAKRAFYKAVGGKYLELHGHFPYYGQYWNEGEWGAVGEYERARLAAEKTKGTVDGNTIVNPKVHSQKRMLAAIRKLQADDVSVHIYINFTDGDRDRHTHRIPDSINHDEDGQPWPSGWRFCHNIHAWPGSMAYKDFVIQAKKLMEYYPADGFFFDCFRHYDFDFAHSDGITMINNKSASCVNFSMARLSAAIMRDVHARNRDSFANKPRTLLSMANVDGMLLEGDGLRSEMYYFYTTLAKPNFYMWGRGVINEEECLKRCVVLGAWPNTPVRVQSDEAITLYAKYLPLIRALNRRVFCFEPDPIRLDFGLTGELYTVGRDYMAGITQSQLSWKDEPLKEPRKVAFIIAQPDFVARVMALYAGEKQWREIPVYRADNQVVVPLPLLRSACVVQLVMSDKPNKQQQPVAAVKDYFNSCGDPVSAFAMGHGAHEKK
ncbi:MAG: hypothetical protein V1899_01080 [Planctomycetota bacterium]